MLRNSVTVILVLVIFLGTGTAYAASHLAVEPPSTSQEVPCSEDGLASVDVTNGQLHWDRNFLTFGSETT